MRPMVSSRPGEGVGDEGNPIWDVHKLRRAREQMDFGSLNLVAHPFRDVSCPDLPTFHWGAVLSPPPGGAPDTR
jgi:hypothetical protein